VGKVGKREKNGRLAFRCTDGWLLYVQARSL